MITIIAAVSTDGIIGQFRKMPWHLPSDLQHFRHKTTGHTVVMGRKTWSGISRKFRPLPDRRNIVVSRDPTFVPPGAEVVHSVEDALAVSEFDQEVFIAGGGEIYHQTIPIAERLLITRVHMAVDGQGTVFPIIDPNAWRQVSSTNTKQEPGDDYPSHIEDYTPRLPYIELANVRTQKQLTEYRLIRKRGHCPFCQENLALYHHQPILYTGDYWLLTPSEYPYPGTDQHLLLILRQHANTFGEVPREAQLELFDIIAREEQAGRFLGGGLCGRAGDPLGSGASVLHLHLHLITPTRGAEPIKFFLGKGPR